MKRESIKNYISKINLKDESKVSVKQIKLDLKNILGEEPAVRISHKKDVFINEIMGTTQEIQKMDKIAITFTDLDNQLKTVEFLVD